MAHEEAYERLIQAARAGEFVHYGELAKLLGVGPRRWRASRVGVKVNERHTGCPSAEVRQ